MGSGRETNPLQKTAAYGYDPDGGKYILPLAGSGSSVVISGAVTISQTVASSFESFILTVTTTPTVIPISLTTNSIIIKAHFNNSQTVYLGGSTVSSSGWPLFAGDELSIDYDDSSSPFYAIASATSLINVIGAG